MGIIKSGYNGLDKGPPVRVRPVGPCVTNIRLSSQVYATALLSRFAYPPGTSCPTRRITFTCYPQSIPDAPRHAYALYYLISGTASSSPQYHGILDITTSPKGIHRQIWAFYSRYSHQEGLEAAKTLIRGGLYPLLFVQLCPFRSSLDVD